MGLFLVWCHRLICIVLSLCKHAYKEVCDVKQGINPYPLLARSCDRWWPDFVTFTACKRSIFGLKRRKKAQCVSNRCKDIFKRKKDFWVMGTLRLLIEMLNWPPWILSFLSCSFVFLVLDKLLHWIYVCKPWSHDFGKAGNAANIHSQLPRMTRAPKGGKNRYEFSHLCKKSYQASGWSYDFFH